MTTPSLLHKAWNIVVLLLILILIYAVFGGVALGVVLGLLFLSLYIFGALEPYGSTAVHPIPPDNEEEP